MLGTGVVSLPYHHPFNVAQRIVQLDHLTRGRAMLGTGPGALPSDARTHGISPSLLRDRQDEALGVILRLLRGEERFSYQGDWFELHDAALQLLPLQEQLAVTAASTISPSGMKLAGKHGIGVLSVASNTAEGLAALPTQWGIAQTYAAECGQAVDRASWRVLFSWHVAETHDQAVAEVAEGLRHWHNEYNVRILGRPGAERVDDGRALAEGMNAMGIGAIGTPDEVAETILRVHATSGGFGTALGFVHDWAGPEATDRSWDLFARYVVPRINGYTRSLEASAEYLSANKAELMGGAVVAVMEAINKHHTRAVTAEETRAGSPMVVPRAARAGD